MSNSLDLGQAGHFVGPNLGPKVCKGCQPTTKMAASKESVNDNYHFYVPGS